MVLIVYSRLWADLQCVVITGKEKEREAGGRREEKRGLEEGGKVIHVHVIPTNKNSCGHGRT